MIPLDSTDQQLTLGRIASGANALMFAFTNPCRTLLPSKLSQSAARPRPFGIHACRSWWKFRRASQRVATRETYENHYRDSCNRREANRGDWVLIRQ